MPCVANIHTWQDGIRSRSGCAAVTTRSDFVIADAYLAMTNGRGWTELHLFSHMQEPPFPEPDMEFFDAEHYVRIYEDSTYWRVTWFRTEEEAFEFGMDWIS